MSRAWWTWARLTGGLAILVVLVLRVGTGPFVEAVREVDAWSLAAAGGIAVVTTVGAAWRWGLVARGLGIEVPLGQAVAAYYRSQFLNTVLPGGVLGDVHRGVRHGRDVGDVGRGLRAVVWERSAGQVVQVGLTVGVLLVLPSPVQSAMPTVVAVLALGTLGAVLLARTPARSGDALRARTLRTISTDLRDGVFAAQAWPGIVVASVLVVAGHTLTFLVAARTVGVTAPTLLLAPLALLVLQAMSLPTNFAGWGPREGAAAWAFAAAGLGAAEGVAVAVVYGLMALVASLPGAVVLVVDLVRREPRPVGAEVVARG